MFPCTNCGLCCQNIFGIEELKDYDLGNGVCKNFDFKKNNCKIYDNRPNICRIDKMFNIKYSKYFSKDEFYIENAKVCNSLQKSYKLDNIFRVKLKG